MFLTSMSTCRRAYLFLRVQVARSPLSGGDVGPSVRAIDADEAVLLRKLYRARKFGGSHLLEANLLRGIPRDRVDDFRSALRALKREGILKAKSTAHGPAVSIPPWLVRELLVELRKHYPDFMP